MSIIKENPRCFIYRFSLPLLLPTDLMKPLFLCLMHIASARYFIKEEKMQNFLWIAIVLLVASCSQSNVKSNKVQLVAKPMVTIEMTMPENQDITITHVMERPGHLVILTRVDLISKEQVFRFVPRSSALEIPPHRHDHRQVVLYGQVDCANHIEGTCFATWQEAILYYDKEGYKLLAEKIDE